MLDELQQTLALLGVLAHEGLVEERRYQSQRLLGPDEQQRWIAAANAAAGAMRLAPWRPQRDVSP